MGCFSSDFIVAWVSTRFVKVGGGQRRTVRFAQSRHYTNPVSMKCCMNTRWPTLQDRREIGSPRSRRSNAVREDLQQLANKSREGYNKIRQTNFLQEKITRPSRDCQLQHCKTRSRLTPQLQHCKTRAWLTPQLQHCKTRAWLTPQLQHCKTRARLTPQLQHCKTRAWLIAPHAQPPLCPIAV